MSGLRIDLAILDADGAPVLLIEVWHTLAVDFEKRKNLSPYWWIEVEANQVLADNCAKPSADAIFYHDAG